MRNAASIVLAFGLVSLDCAQADVTLPAVFSDHMVLQRDMPLRIFGRAQAGEAVLVTLRDASGATIRTGRATAGQDGVFGVTLEPLAASAAPLTLEVAGATTVTVQDVLVGEVWIAGGQSNMEWPVGATGTQAADAAALASVGTIRQIKAPHVTAFRPQASIAAEWRVLAPSTVNDFGAVAFWFAQDLREALGVPVGILAINWGGTRAEPWVDLATLASHARFEASVAEHRARVEEWSSMPQALRDRAWSEEWAKFQRQANEWWASVQEADPGVAGAWASPGTEVAGDTEGWTTATLPARWSTDPALRDFDGTVWYRRTVDIPAEWAGKECVVEIGPVDDADVLFVDGRAVANTVGDLQTPRRYRVPGSMMKAGPCVLAIQVLDTGGEGGLMAGPMRMTCTAAAAKDGAESSDDQAGGGNTVIALDGPWMRRVGRALDGIQPPPARPVRVAPPGMRPTDPAALHHAMIAPFAGFAVRGAIWYQGESNASNPEEAEAYRDLLPLVVRSWRAAFERPDMPFGVVSLAAFRTFDPDRPQAGVWPILRESQLAAETQVPNVGVVTTIDVGDAGDIHPRDKRTVGRRLARWARATAYGQSAQSWRGPRAARARHDGDGVVIEFDVERPPLAARDGGALQGFAIAGEDGVFHWATATIATPTTIRLQSPAVPRPVEVRYAWQDNPANANLVDSGGEASLPAHPFRVRLNP